MANAWMHHLKEFYKKNKDKMSYKQAMKEAKKTYKPPKKEHDATTKRKLERDKIIQEGLKKREKEKKVEQALEDAGMSKADIKQKKLLSKLTGAALPPKLETKAERAKLVRKYQTYKKAVQEGLRKGALDQKSFNHFIALAKLLAGKSKTNKYVKDYKKIEKEFKSKKYQKLKAKETEPLTKATQKALDNLNRMLEKQVPIARAFEQSRIKEQKIDQAKIKFINEEMRKGKTKEQAEKLWELKEDKVRRGITALEFASDSVKDAVDKTIEKGKQLHYQTFVKEYAANKKLSYNQARTVIKKKGLYEAAKKGKKPESKAEANAKKATIGATDNIKLDITALESLGESSPAKEVKSKFYQADGFTLKKTFREGLEKFVDRFQNVDLSDEAAVNGIFIGRNNNIKKSGGDASVFYKIRNLPSDALNSTQKQLRENVEKAYKEAEDRVKSGALTVAQQAQTQAAIATALAAQAGPQAPLPPAPPLNPLAGYDPINQELATLMFNDLGTARAAANSDALFYQFVNRVINGQLQYGVANAKNLLNLNDINNDRIAAGIQPVNPPDYIVDTQDQTTVLQRMENFNNIRTNPDYKNFVEHKLDALLIDSGNNQEYLDRLDLAKIAYKTSLKDRVVALGDKLVDAADLDRFVDNMGEHFEHSQIHKAYAKIDPVSGDLDGFRDAAAKDNAFNNSAKRDITLPRGFYENIFKLSLYARIYAVASRSIDVVDSLHRDIRRLGLNIDNFINFFLNENANITEATRQEGKIIQLTGFTQGIDYNQLSPQLSLRMDVGQKRQLSNLFNTVDDMMIDTGVAGTPRLRFNAVMGVRIAEKFRDLKAANGGNKLRVTPDFIQTYNDLVNVEPFTTGEEQFVGLSANAISSVGVRTGAGLADEEEGGDFEESTHKGDHDTFDENDIGGGLADKLFQKVKRLGKQMPYIPGFNTTIRGIGRVKGRKARVQNRIDDQDRIYLEVSDQTYKPPAQRVKQYANFQYIGGSPEEAFYKCDSTKQIIAGYRGSTMPGQNFVDDWLVSDRKIAVGRLTTSDRYKRMEKDLREMVNKYPDYNFILTGHSLGGALAIELGKAFKLPSVVFNAGHGAFTKGHEKSKYYHAKGDAVSLNGLGHFNDQIMINNTAHNSISAHLLDAFKGADEDGFASSNTADQLDQLAPRKDIPTEPTDDLQGGSIDISHIASHFQHPSQYLSRRHDIQKTLRRLAIKNLKKKHDTSEDNRLYRNLAVKALQMDRQHLRQIPNRLQVESGGNLYHKIFGKKLKGEYSGQQGLADMDEVIRYNKEEAILPRLARKLGTALFNKLLNSRRGGSLLTADDHHEIYAKTGHHANTLLANLR